MLGSDSKSGLDALGMAGYRVGWGGGVVGLSSTSEENILGLMNEKSESSINTPQRLRPIQDLTSDWH